MGTDLSKPPLELIIGLINRTNSTAFQTGDIIFGNPQPYTDPEGGFFNTSIVATGTGGTRFQGPKTLYYHRLPLVSVFEDRDTELFFPYGTASVTTAALIAALNAKFGFALVSGDFVNDSWDLDPDVPVQATLVADSDSIILIDQVDLSLSMLEEIIEDEMHFRLIPDQAYFSHNEETHDLSLIIGGNCGYPFLLTSSVPSDYLTRQFENATELVLLSGKLIACPYDLTRTLETGRSTYASGIDGAYFRPTREDVDPVFNEIATLTIDSANSGRLTVKPPSDWWLSMTPGYQGLMAHLTFSHPSFPEVLHYQYFSATPYFVPNT